MNFKVYKRNDFIFLFGLFITHRAHRFKRLHWIILVLFMNFLVILILESDFSDFDFKTVLFHSLNWNICWWSSSWMFGWTLWSMIGFIIKFHQLADGFKFVCFFVYLLLPFLKLIESLAGQMTVFLGADELKLGLLIKLVLRVGWLGETFGAVFVDNWGTAIFDWNFQGFLEFFLVFVQVNPVSSKYTMVWFPTSQIFVFNVQEPLMDFLLLNLESGFFQVF